MVCHAEAVPWDRLSVKNRTVRPERARSIPIPTGPPKILRSPCDSTAMLSHEAQSGLQGKGNGLCLVFSLLLVFRESPAYPATEEVNCFKEYKGLTMMRTMERRCGTWPVS
jgi:hypothetical protein